jgi:hypothetical protein
MRQLLTTGAACLLVIASVWLSHPLAYDFSLLERVRYSSREQQCIRQNFLKVQEGTWVAHRGFRQEWRMHKVDLAKIKVVRTVGQNIYAVVEIEGDVVSEQKRLPGAPEFYINDDREHPNAIWHILTGFSFFGREKQRRRLAFFFRYLTSDSPKPADILPFLGLDTTVDELGISTVIDRRIGSIEQQGWMDRFEDELRKADQTFTR